MNGIRLAAALVLAVQLNQLAVPALCAPRQPAAPCHQTADSGTPQLWAPGAAHEMPCAQSAMCVAPTVALPEAATLPRGPALLAVVTPGAGVLRLGDAPQPLSPPPQA